MLRHPSGGRERALPRPAGAVRLPGRRHGRPARIPPAGPRGGGAHRRPSQAGAQAGGAVRPGPGQPGHRPQLHPGRRGIPGPLFSPGRPERDGLSGVYGRQAQGAGRAQAGRGLGERRRHHLPQGGGDRPGSKCHHRHPGPQPHLRPSPPIPGRPDHHPQTPGRSPGGGGGALRPPHLRRRRHGLPPGQRPV